MFVELAISCGTCWKAEESGWRWNLTEFRSCGKTRQKKAHTRATLRLYKIDRWQVNLHMPLSLGFLTIAFYFKIEKNFNPVTFWLHAQGSIFIIRENLQVLV